jgi:hypothetical protein
MDMYTRETVIVVRPFTRQREGEDVIIGCTETGGFLAVDPEAVELLEQLGQGSSVGEVSDRYQETHGEAPDLDHFLSLLETKGFIEPQVKDNGASTLRQRPGRGTTSASFPKPLPNGSSAGRFWHAFSYSLRWRWGQLFATRRSCPWRATYIFPIIAH